MTDNNLSANNTENNNDLFDGKKLKVLSKDNLPLEVNFKSAILCETVKSVINYDDNDEFDFTLIEDSEVPLSDVNYNTLVKVFEYCDQKISGEDERPYTRGLRWIQRRTIARL